ncbi:glycosyltransferase [Isoptericola sp. NPDC056573]|uniref:glycosyltransferase n=1 Tax=Isoptericola sp. NPDC056573 TaxID=3345868 RepID=UPI0036C7775D
MPHSHGPTTTRLPDGGHAAATWSIPADFGGMTSALLRRSRAFVEQGGAPVRVLTFDPALDLDAARARLEERGQLVPGVTLHNLWADVRAMSDEEVGARAGAAPRPDLPRGAPGERARLERSGETTRHLHFRPDGSVAAVDESTPTGREVRFYTGDGRPGRRWSTVWALYRHWVGTVLTERPTYVVVDSKALTKFFANLEIKGIYTLHLVHGAHLTAAATDAHGPLAGTRAPMIEHVGDYDAVVFLTEGQRRDVHDRVGARDNTYVVPNSTDLPDGALPAHADRYRGVMLASLSRRKRVGHAIAGLRRARAGSGLPLTLDVYGEGPERERLEPRAAKVPGVTLHGYVTGAADRLADASFLLLTSRAEGLPLVFAEAMARGCVPIAFDVRYGPADIITDGVDGFLVPDADVDALAAAIVRFVSLDDDVVRRMREAAVATAQRYSDVAVVGRWAEVFEDVARRRPVSPRTAGRPAGPPRYRRSTLSRAARKVAGMLRRAGRRPHRTAHLHPEEGP